MSKTTKTSKSSKPGATAPAKPKPKPRRRRRPAAVAVSQSRWNPERDAQIAAPYSAAKPAGKAQCKAALQAELGFKIRSRVPLYLFVGELDAEHGGERLLEALPALLKTSVQIMLLAPQGGALATRADHLAREHAERVALVVGEDEALLRRALAGADIVLVPAAGSGAIAWRSLRYGAVVVAPAGSEVPALLVPPAGTRRRGAAAAEVEASPAYLFRSPTALALGRAALKAGEAYRDAAAWRRRRRAALEVSEQPDEAILPRVERALPPAVRQRAFSPVLTLAETARQTTDTGAAGAEPTGEPYIDWGPAPPERYGEDALELLVQSPRQLYGYWELGPERQTASPSAVRLVLHVDETERVLAAAVADLGEWWVEAEPGHRYRLELRRADGRTLLESAPVRTPREAGSERDEVRFSAPRRGEGRSAKEAPPAAGGAGEGLRDTPAAPPPRAALPQAALPRAGSRRVAASKTESSPAAPTARGALSERAGAPAGREPALSPAPSSLERAGAGRDAESPLGSSEHSPRKRR